MQEEKHDTEKKKRNKKKKGANEKDGRMGRGHSEGVRTSDPGPVHRLVG